MARCEEGVNSGLVRYLIRPYIIECGRGRKDICPKEAFAKKNPHIRRVYKKRKSAKGLGCICSFPFSLSPFPSLHHASFEDDVERKNCLALAGMFGIRMNRIFFAIPP